MFPSGGEFVKAYLLSLLHWIPMALLVLIPLGALLWFFGAKEKELKAIETQEQERKLAEEEARRQEQAEEEARLEAERQERARQEALLEAQRLAAAAQAKLAADRKRILIVDDSAVVRTRLRKLFETRYDVSLACDGQEAWQMIEASEPFAAVLTDLEMPNMDGFELIAAIQGGLATEDVPIVAITGSDELQARVRSCQGLYGIFQKPWVDRELLKRIDAITGMKAG